MDQTLEKRVALIERALTRLHPNWERELVASDERCDELRLQLRSLGKRLSGPQINQLNSVFPDIPNWQRSQITEEHQRS